MTIKTPQKRIALVAIPPVRLLDVVGPLEVFGEANLLAKKQAPYKVSIISATSELHVRSHLHMPLLADASYLESNEPFDTLLVAGGEGARSPHHDRKFLLWLRKQCHAARRYGSVCTGAMVLAEAGLLDGRNATTHWRWCELLAARHHRVEVDPRPIFVRSQQCYTSAGVTAGIDLSMALVEEDLGRDVALKIAQEMVVFLRRPGGQSQFSVTLASQAQDVTSLGDLLPWLADQLETPLSTKAMAQKAAMSPRNLRRVFLRDTGKTPRRYLEDLRLETARRLLETTSSSLEAIAERCGLTSPDVLRRTFLRRLNVTPSAYRRSFGRSRKTS